METLKGQGAKLRLKAAISIGNVDETNNAAAEIIQSIFRTRLANKNMEARRIEKVKLNREICSRKIQGLFRSWVSRKQVNKIRIEKQQRQLQVAVLKIQGTWMCYKANKRIKEMRQQRDKLRQEGAAISVQSAWRCRNAKKRAQMLKTQKRQKYLEMCALKLQKSWRMKAAKLKRNRREKLLLEMKQNHSSTVLQSCVKRLLAVRALNRQRLGIGAVLNLQFKDITNVLISGIDTSELYVIASGIEVIIFFLQFVQMINSLHFCCAEVLNGGIEGLTASIYKSKVVPDSTKQTFQTRPEEGYISGLRSVEDNIIFTILSQADDCVGQVFFVLLLIMILLCGCFLNVSCISKCRLYYQSIK